MTRRTTPSFVQDFELQNHSEGKGSLRDLEKASEQFKRLFNAGLGHFLSIVKAMKSSIEWSEARKLPRASDKDKMNRSACFIAIRKKYGISSIPDVEKYLKELVSKSPDALFWTNSAVVQKIASRIFNSIEKLIYAKSKRVRFKRKGELVSFEGKSNATGVRLISSENGVYVLVSKLKYFVQYDQDNPYHIHALTSRVKFCRILIKNIRGVNRFYVQLVLEGLPYEDLSKKIRHEGLIVAEHGEDYFDKKANLPDNIKEKVAYDLGPRFIDVSTPVSSFRIELSHGVETKQKVIKRIQRKMDRQRRANNPQNFAPNGTIIKGPKIWNNSIGYLKSRTQYREIERQKCAQRKSRQGFLSNQIIAFGNEVVSENVSIKGWQKRYGKSISHHAPSGLEAMLTRKAENARGSHDKISTYQTRLSQTCICGAIRKKKLSEREHSCSRCGFKAPRDLLSAFLAIFATIEYSTKGDALWTIDLESARAAITGHRTLSLSYSDVRDTKDEKTAWQSQEARVQSSLESIA